MRNILFYLLQMIIASGMLYGYYHFFLRNKKFHRYNRFFLLCTVIISIIIPFLNIPVYFSKESTDSSVLLQTLSVISYSGEEETAAIVLSESTNQIASWFSWQNIIYSLYILIAMIFIVRIYLSVRKIRIISGNYPQEKIGDINFVNTSEPGTPFSFFRWLFWNNNIELNSDKGQQIFRHELFHINQRHTLDTVFMEFITALIWFNPIFHLIKKELKTIHEFLADEYAMNKKGDWQYAELLLMQALNTKLSLVTPFFHNQIKRRIAMITSSQKPGHQYLRKLLVLPVAAIIAVLFAFSYKSINADDNSIRSKQQITVVVDVGHGGIDPGAKSPDGKYTEAQLTLELSKKIEELAPDHNIKVVLTRDKDELPGNSVSRTEALKKRIEVASQYNPDAFISIHISIDGSFNKFQNKSSGFQAYITDEKPAGKNIALAKIVLGELNTIYTTDPGVKQREGPGIYVLDKNIFPALLLECGYINNAKDLAFISDKANQEKVAKAILNAVSKFVNESELQKAISEKIREQIEISKKSINLQDTAVKLVVTNGIVYSHMTMAQVDKVVKADYIESVTVLKGKTATDKYGDVGRNGVIEITQKQFIGKPIIDTPKVKTVEVTLTDTSKRLVILDGKIIGHVPLNEIDNLFPFEEIDFFSGTIASATKSKYGEAGKNGFLEFYTKKYTAAHPEIKAERKAIYDRYNKNNNLPLKEVVVTGYLKKESNEAPLDNATPIFEKVETPPSFPGGIEAWTKYLEKNLDVEAPLSSGAKPGRYTVMVRFIVDKNGNVSSIRTLTNFGYGMEAEVVRVIAKGPNWIPAKQNGHIVNAYQTQPVTFEIKEGVKKDVPAITTSQNQPNSLPNYPKISVNEIQKATAYDLTWVEPGAEISSFILSSDNDAGTIDDVPNYGNSLNTRVKELIGSTKPGRTITIDKINIVKNGKSEKLPSKVYFVTN